MWEEIQHAGARAARDLDKPLVITPHGMLDRWSLRHSGRWKKQVSLWWRVGADLRGADAIHFTTEPERRSAARYAEGKMTIVEPLGVDLTEFERLPPRGTFRAQHPSMGDRPVVIFLGRIDGGKGLEYLVPALARLANPRAVLAIVGPDGTRGFRQEVEATVSRLGLRERVLFTGMLRGARRIEALVDADLFALPSHHENFGLAVIESLAAGTPVVISDQVNVREEIVAAGVGAAVPCDVDAVAAELDRWLADAGLRQRAAIAAREFVWQRYDWRQIARHWREHYARIIDAHGARRAVARPAHARKDT
jgi:glycosyltransferase involved in cell wall biosynthesis